MKRNKLRSTEENGIEVHMAQMNSAQTIKSVNVIATAFQVPASAGKAKVWFIPLADERGVCR